MSISARTRVYLRRNPIIILLLTVVLCAATVTVMAVAYDHKQHENDRRFCTLMHVLLQPGARPTTPRGFAVRDALADLSGRLGCDGKH